MIRRETKARARALQLLYAWELQGQQSIHDVARRIQWRDPRCHETLEQAESLATAVASEVAELDAAIAHASENWRLERIGAIERNILRLGCYELGRPDVPPKVVINEAIRLTRWFAGSKAAPFVNGVLDALARRADRL